MTEVEWLAEWRRKRAEAKNKYVPLSADSFGVVQAKSMSEVLEYEVSHRPVAYLIVGGSFRQRHDVHDAFSGVPVRLLTEEEAKRREYVGAKIRYDHWPTFTTMANTLVRSGTSVLLDGESVRGRVRSLAESLFANGARSVIVIDPTTMYEEEWIEDGVTGVYWPKW